MDIVASPIVTATLNILAGYLISKGLLDQGSREVFVHVSDNILAALTTIIVSVYSIYKIVELHKHSITSNNQMLISGNQAPSTPINSLKQTGLPLPTNSTQK